MVKVTVKIGGGIGLAALVLAGLNLAGCKGGEGGGVKTDSMAAGKSLYERLGGAEAIKAVVADFVGKAASDPKVDFTRGGKYQVNVEDLQKKLADFIGQAAGGPEKYTGKDMKTAHKGMAITKDQFNAIAGHLQTSLEKFKVGPAEIGELMKVIGGTMGDIVGQ